jgi:hypothetical protein
VVGTYPAPDVTPEPPPMRLREIRYGSLHGAAAEQLIGIVEGRWSRLTDRGIPAAWPTSLDVLERELDIPRPVVIALAHMAVAQGDLRWDDAGCRRLVPAGVGGAS